MAPPIHLGVSSMAPILWLPLLEKGFIIVVRCVISCSDQLSFCTMPVEYSRLVEELHKLGASPVATPVLYRDKLLLA